MAQKQSTKNPQAGFAYSQDQFQQLIGRVPHADVAHVQDHDRRADANGGVHRLEGVLERLFAFARVLGRELENVGRRALDD